MAMVKATFFLPVRDNDGRSLRAEIRVLEDALFARFPGYTRMASVFGVFRMADGTKVKDRCRSYFLWLDEGELEVLKGIIRTFKSATTQEAIHFDVLYNTTVDFLCQGASVADRESLENEIRRLVAAMTDGTGLSNALFSTPDGLFSKLGPTRIDREAILRSDLYRIAQDRIHDLTEIEEECFAKARVEIARLAQAQPIRGLLASDANH